MSFLGLFDSEDIDETKPMDVDTRGMEYGAGGGGDERQDFYDEGAYDAGKRKGVQIDYTNADESRRQGQGSRADMYGQMQSLRDMANGSGHSAAMSQLQMGRDQGMRDQMGMAASGRTGNMAQAMRSGQAAGADQMARTNGQAAALRGQEQMQYTGMLNQMMTQQRAMDLQAQGLDASQAQAQAQMEMQQRQMNDQYQLGMYGLGEQAMQGQMQGAAAGQGLLGQQYLGAAGLTQQAQIANQQADAQRDAAVLGAAAGAMTGGLGALGGGAPKP